MAYVSITPPPPPELLAAYLNGAAMESPKLHVVTFSATSVATPTTMRTLDISALGLNSIAAAWGYVTTASGGAIGNVWGIHIESKTTTQIQYRAYGSKQSSILLLGALVDGLEFKSGAIASAAMWILGT